VAQGKCPICSIDAQNVSKEISNEHFVALIVECRRCGRFMIGYLLERMLVKPSPDIKSLLPYLSAYTRQETEKGILPPVLTCDNWQAFAQAHTNTTASHKSNKLLKFLESRSSYHGEQVQINIDLDYPVIDASSSVEAEYFLDELARCDYITCLREVINIYHTSITVKGWRMLEQPECNAMETSRHTSLQINIRGNVGIFNQGEIANINSLTVNVSSLAESGNVEVANALKNLTEAIASSQELTAEKRAEALDLLEELSKQANLARENRSKPVSLKAIATELTLICSTAGGLATVWGTYGSAIKTFLGF
jgi:hypothetical protein